MEHVPFAVLAEQHLDVPKILKKLFKSPRIRRSEEVEKLLAKVAVQPIAEPSFEDKSAFVRAYTVALSIVIPQYTVAVSFPETVYPPWKDIVWRKPDQVFENLAAMLAWRSCLAAFNDLEQIFEEEDINEARKTLMNICGETFPASEQANKLIRQYDKFNRDINSRKIFFEQGYVVSEDHMRNMKHLEIHAYMVNEALEEPPLSNRDNDPMHIFGLSIYLSKIEVGFMSEFRERGLDLIKKHIAAGRP